MKNYSMNNISLKLPRAHWGGHVAISIFIAKKGERENESIREHS